MADLPKNRFKAGIRSGTCQIGLWTSLPGTVPVELLSASGFDWLVLDTEHAPSDPLTVLPQMQTMVAHHASPVVRPAWNDKVLIKRFLDLGAQTQAIMIMNLHSEYACACSDGLSNPAHANDAQSPARDAPSQQIGGRPTLPVSRLHCCQTIRHTARHSKNESHCHIGCIIGQHTGCVGNKNTILAGRVDINMIDTGTIICDQFQPVTSLPYQLGINRVGNRRHQNIRIGNRCNYFFAAHWRVVVAQPHVKQLFHPGFHDLW